MQGLWNWAFNYVGSTRAAALIRIAFSMILLYRFGPEFFEASKLLGLLFLASTILMGIGLFSQLSTLVAGLLAVSTYYYGWAWKGDVVWAHHHTYFIGMATVILAMSPCGRSYSVDRLLALAKARREGRPDPLEEGNLFALRLLAIQMACMYFFAFWDKAIMPFANAPNYSFISGQRLEQIFTLYYYGSSFVFEPWMKLLACAASISVIVLELVLPLLLIERFQKWLILPGLGLHFGFYVLLSLQTYSISCMVLYLAIVNANKVHGWLELLKPQRQLPLYGQRPPGQGGLNGAMPEPA